jgi:rRNA maturation protein Rpf1
MKTVTLEIEDSKFEQFMTVINALRSDLITKFEVKKKEDDEAIDEQHCMEVLDKINRKDYIGMKKVSSDELFKELGL